MADLFSGSQPTTEEEEKKTKEDTSGIKVTTQAAVTPTSTPTTQGASKPQQRGTAEGQKFASLRKYIQANQPQVKQQAEQVGQTATQKSTQLQEQSAQEKQAAETLLQPQVQEFQDVAATVSKPEFMTTEGLVQAAGTEGFADRLQQAQTGQLQTFDTARLADEAKLAQDLQKDVEKVRTEEGRFALLRDAFKAPGYSTGEQKLDQLLLQTSPEAQQVFGQTEARGREEIGKFDKLRDYITSSNKAVQTAADQTVQKINELNLANEYGITEDQVREARDTARANMEAEFQAAISGQDPTATFGASTGLIGRGSTAQFGDVVTEDQAARYGALGTLLGQQPGIDVATKTEGFSTAPQMEAFRQEVEKRKGDYASAIQNKQSEIKQFTDQAEAIERAGMQWAGPNWADAASQHSVDLLNQRNIALANAERAQNELTSMASEFRQDVAPLEQYYQQAQVHETRDALFNYAAQKGVSPSAASYLIKDTPEESIANIDRYIQEQQKEQERIERRQLEGAGR